MDAAENLYVLDGKVSTITVVPLTGNRLPGGLCEYIARSAPSALAISAGAQSFVIANIGNGTVNSLVYLNGNSSTLAFGNVKTATSPSQTATVYNIGNAIAEAGESDRNRDRFTILNFSTTC